ncbi:hypothetical protein GCM10022224_014120 [Nonomuraea antimicrobica]|uniref:Uncharacterized protein n=1 Tax=Nonomuraea antimicrobica TaxID=561173 RepID=A0ABP7B808_9ACTN
MIVYFTLLTPHCTDVKAQSRPAQFHIIKNGPTISAKHVGTTGAHRDESDTFGLDGIATRPA